MTREELIEDIEIGGYIKVYSVTGEDYVGRVAEFGPSGVKLVLDGSRIKRISYDRILEYDILDEPESSKMVNAAPVKQQVTESAGTPEVPERKVIVDRDTIFGETGTEIAPEDVRSPWEESLTAAQKKEYAPVADSIAYARKIREYTLNGDRVTRGLRKLETLAKTDAIFSVFAGIIYHEFNKFAEASAAYAAGGAYDAAFSTGLSAGTAKNLYELAVMAVYEEQYSEGMIRWLCDEAVKKNSAGTIAFLLEHCPEYKGQILLYWYADRDDLGLLPAEDPLADSNIDFLYERFAPQSLEDAGIAGIIEKYTKKDEEDDQTPANVTNGEEETLRGVIERYNTDTGTGWIIAENRDKIYFYIKQVRDTELQKILQTENDVSRPVTFTLGINKYMKKAADAVELDWRADQQDCQAAATAETVLSGVITEYTGYQETGQIFCNGKNYRFFLSDVKDPFLRAELAGSFETKLYDVTFGILRKNRSGKKETVAVNIAAEKEYTEEEIQSSIKTGTVTREEADRFLGKAGEPPKPVVFRTVTYEPLLPYHESLMQADPELPKKTQIIKRTPVIESESKGKEREAVRLMLKDAGKNPFEGLESIKSRENFYEKAHQYQVGWKNYKGETEGVDLDRAEELYVKAIQANNQAGAAVANLVNIYIQRGGSYVVKGLQLLEEYGYLLAEEKLTNVYVQLIDKSANFEALELILLSALPRCSRENTVWQYTVKLAWIYYKRQDWDQAIQWFNKGLDILEKNRKSFAGYEAMRQSNIRSLIICHYQLGDHETALSMAKEYLKISPQDPVILSIVDGTFTSEQSADVLEEALEFEDEFLDVTGNDISRYLSYQLDNVNLAAIFSKVNDVYSKIQDGVYTGTSDDVKEAVSYIRDKMLGQAKQAMSADLRSTIHIGIARLINDSRNNVEAADKKVALDEVKASLGTYARYAADAYVEKSATDDSVRFMYIQALRYMSVKDDGNIGAAVSMLMASFFMEKRQLSDELHGYKGRQRKFSYFSGHCVSVKDFLIAAFMLQSRQEYADQILQEAFKVPKFREELIAFLEKNAETSGKITNYYEFESVFRDVRRKYNNTFDAIGKEIETSISEWALVESLRQHVQRIRELMDVKLLWNQDEKVLMLYLEILDEIESTMEKYTVEEKIDGFRSVEGKIENLKKTILEAPTELSYDCIYTRLDGLKSAVREGFNALYQSSRPECTIALSNNSVYVNDKSAGIAITFKNQGDKQDADAVEIELFGSPGAKFLRCDKKFTSIHGGEEQEYMASFQLSDRVIEEGQFEVTVNLRYQYRDSVDHVCTFETTEILPVTITDKENYVKIENKYDRIIRGSSVDVKTPELFKGRGALIDSICDSMSSRDGVMTKNRGIILWGQRRVGKNSVKDYLKEKIKNQYPDAYLIIELGSVGKCRNLKEVLITIVDKTEDVLMQDYPEIYDRLSENGLSFPSRELDAAESYMPIFARFMDRLHNGLQKISEQEKNIPLYFLDEFSYLYEWIETGELNGKEFMRFWKSFIQDNGICAIIIAQDNIPVWKLKYENEFACMSHNNEITYLNFDGAKELICEPCQTGDKPLFTEDAVRLIFDLTKGSAYLIVIFCKYIIDYLNDNYTEKATKTIVQIVFEREFLDKKDLFLSDDFEPQIQDVASVGEEGERVNRLNKRLLREIAKETVSSPRVRKDDLVFFKEEPEEGDRIFGRLKERKIIEVESDIYCSISMPLLKYYLLREQSLLTREVFNKLIR